MTSIVPTNPLQRMMDNVFTKVDKDSSGALDHKEFGAMYEVLKAGIAVNRDGTPKISEGQEFDRMDRNSDGKVTRDEMQTTGVLMPASLTDPSLEAIIGYLKLNKSAASQSTAALLSMPDPEPQSTTAATNQP